jgi:putative addiction module killer protein
VEVPAISSEGVEIGRLDASVWPPLRIPYGPGYRVYFLRRGDAVVVLLGGGDKSSQKRDVERAKEIASRL